MPKGPIVPNNKILLLVWMSVDISGDRTGHMILEQ
jgi:hypothetical protein